MNSDVKFMLTLIGAIVSGSSLPDCPPNINWNLIYALSKKHSIVNIIAYGISLGRFDVSKEIAGLFMQRMYEQIAVSENQSLCISQIFKAFDENAIDYMPLKGTKLQNLYAAPDMRTMSDADILIRKESIDKIKQIMNDLGYTFELESNHEFVFKKPPFMNVELHKLLIPSYNEDMHSYYSDGWQLAEKVSDTGFEYELSKEDNFVYIFTHFAKHYRDAGAGIRPVIDIWLYKNANPDLDYDYINKQMQMLNVDAFYKHFIKMVSAWFENAEFDDISVKMTAFIIDSGTFGTIENQASAKTIRDYMGKDIKKAEKHRYLSIIFPNFKTMKTIFPILEKLPWLLPITWILRILRLILFKRRNIALHKKRAQSVNNENIDKYYEHIKSVGLDIYNGRKER